MSDKPNPKTALENKEWAAPAIGYTEETIPSSLEAAAKPTKRRAFTMDTADIVAFGVIILAFGAVLVAVIVSVGLAFGTVKAKDATAIILSCVGGSALSGLAALLLRR